LWNLVEDEQRLPRRQAGGENLVAVRQHVPVQAGRRRLVPALSQQRQREGRLPHLPRSADEHHRVGEIRLTESLMYRSLCFWRMSNFRYT
jgi:hypothetical protein